MRFSRFISAAAALALLGAAPARRVMAQDAKPPKQSNELTLAGLRPGHDSLAVAFKHFKAKYASATAPGPSGARQWADACTGRSLAIELDAHSMITAVTLSTLVPQQGDCEDRHADALDMKDWVTGRGLRLGDPRDRITDLYGEPNSSGPSVKGTKELEFLRYAFDWAGAGVPQVMEVYCARDSGRVLEITLSDSSL